MERNHVSLHSCCNSHTHSRSICDSISCIVLVIAFSFYHFSIYLSHTHTKLDWALHEIPFIYLKPLSKRTHKQHFTDRKHGWVNATESRWGGKRDKSKDDKRWNEFDVDFAIVLIGNETTKIGLTASPLSHGIDKEWGRRRRVKRSSVCNSIYLSLWYEIQWDFVDVISW